VRDSTTEQDRKEKGIRIIRAGELDGNTPQTPGMTRAAAVTHGRTGASKLWAILVVVNQEAADHRRPRGESSS
jgi:uncharacterized RmlC-like cupin family protein